MQNSNFYHISGPNPTPRTNQGKNCNTALLPFHQ